MLVQTEYPFAAFPGRAEIAKGLGHISRAPFVIHTEASEKV
jgi:hypothetical protein